MQANITEIGGRGRGRSVNADLFIKKHNFTGTQNTKLQAYYPLAFPAPAPAFFFSRWGIIVLILAGGGKKRVQMPPVWNILSAHKICLRIWELRWLHNSKFQINNLSPANTFLCSYTSICFWKAAGAMERQKRLVLAGELPMEPPVAWVLLATGGRVLFLLPHHK